MGKSKKPLLIGCLALFSLVLYAQEPVATNKIGSHHSLSYSKPEWYWVPFNWMVKCQSLNLKEQIEFGVTYFDIRVRFKKKKVISGHGVMNYDIDVLQALKQLDDHSTDENPLYVRIMYESKPLCKNPSIEEMKAFMAQLKQDYPCLIFTQCHIRNPYTLVETVNDVPLKDCYQFYKDYGAKTLWKKLKGLKLPNPKHYARKNNKNYRNEANNAAVCIFDFVEINQ